GLAELKEFMPEDVIFHEWCHSEHIYLVLQGEVALEVRLPGRGDVAVQTVGPGELLGWSPVLGPGGMTATGRARTRCRLAALNARLLQQAGERDPRLGMECLRRIGAAVACRLNALRRELRTPHRPSLCGLALEEGGTD